MNVKKPAGGCTPLGLPSGTRARPGQQDDQRTAQQSIGRRAHYTQRDVERLIARSAKPDFRSLILTYSQQNELSDRLGEEAVVSLNVHVGDISSCTLTSL